MRKPDCVFCKIVEGEISAYTVWEDADHLAFLSRHPNTEGFTVLVTKDHYDSYYAELSDEVLAGLTKAAKSVALLLDQKLDDVGRTGMIFEGFGVNHMHAKLFPMHGTKGEEWKQRLADINTYFDHYEGYISSHDGAEASAEELERVAKKITG